MGAAAGERLLGADAKVGVIPLGHGLRVVGIRQYRESDRVQELAAAEALTVIGRNIDPFLHPLIGVCRLAALQDFDGFAGAIEFEALGEMLAPVVFERSEAFRKKHLGHRQAVGNAERAFDRSLAKPLILGSTTAPLHALGAS